MAKKSKSLFKKFGLVFLWIMTIPSWLLIFMWVLTFSLKAIRPNSMESSEDYNWRLTSLGENPERITINQVDFYEFIEGEGSFFDGAFFPDQKKLIYELKNKEEIKEFFVALAEHKKPISICFPREGGSYFRLRALDHSEMKEGTLTFHFCKIERKVFVIFEPDDNEIHTDYFASSELAEFLASIGIEPR